jgi:hypothetical protein
MAVFLLSMISLLQRLICVSSDLIRSLSGSPPLEAFVEHPGSQPASYQAEAGQTADTCVLYKTSDYCQQAKFVLIHRFLLSLGFLTRIKLLFTRVPLTIASRRNSFISGMITASLNGQRSNCPLLAAMNRALALPYVGV